MKVFISWSGTRSKVVANILSDWIKCVLQATRPWISTRDIDRGALWFSEISDQLKDTTVGIVCLTQDNKNRPWILFEAGALAKGLSSNRVCTFLVDLEPADIEDPLAQFNHTLPDQDGLYQLILTLNSCLGVGGLDERILKQVFDTYWLQFDTSFKEALKLNPPSEKPEPRSEKNLLGDILENTRLLNQRIRSLETQIYDGRRRDVDVLDDKRMLYARQVIEKWVKVGMPDDLVMQEAKTFEIPEKVAIYELMRAKRFLEKEG